MVSAHMKTRKQLLTPKQIVALLSLGFKRRESNEQFDCDMCTDRVQADRLTIMLNSPCLISGCFIFWLCDDCARECGLLW